MITVRWTNCYTTAQDEAEVRRWVSEATYNQFMRERQDAARAYLATLATAALVVASKCECEAPAPVLCRKCGERANEGAYGLCDGCESTTLALVDTAQEAAPAKRRASFPVRTRADVERVLGPLGWAMWKALRREHELSYRTPRNIELRNYAAEAWAHHDGVVVHRVALDLGAGEVHEGGYVSTGECAINERASRRAALDLTTLPSNTVHGFLKYGPKGTTAECCTLELECPDAMLAALPSGDDD
jgi:hypothetical protein